MAVPNQTPNNLRVSEYLLKHCNLWVWDFDDTLIDTTTYYIKSMEPDDIKIRSTAELNKEMPHWKYFRNLVEYLVTSGKRVGIASFGTYEIIQAYMDRIFGYNQKYFTRHNIMASYKDERHKREFKLPVNKNAYIYDLMQFYKIQDYSKVVLFDDSPFNINDAGTIGVLGIQIEGRDQNKIGTTLKLFTEEIMDKIDYQANIRCKANIYMRRDFGQLGYRKAPIRDKQFGVQKRMIYSDRIYVDEAKQMQRAKEKAKKDRLEHIMINKYKKNKLGKSNQLRYTDEGFQNKQECDFCSRVASDKYIWVLLLLLVIFMIYIVRK